MKNFKFAILFFCHNFCNVILTYSQFISGNCVYEFGGIKYQDGSHFVGTFENGTKKIGTYFYSNKDVYTGTFENRQPDVSGTIINKNRKKWKGQLDNGKRV